MKLLKFGGKSLANGQGIKNVISIIESKIKNKEKIYVVVSARGDSTDKLLELLELAKAKKPYQIPLEKFKAYQFRPLEDVSIQKEIKLIENLLKGIELTGDYSLKIKDKLLAQGEIISAKTVSALLNTNVVKSIDINSSQFLITDDTYGNATIKSDISEKRTIEYFNGVADDIVTVITGFIASSTSGEITTLGRNGTNYTASLIANYLDIKHIESYTHVDGIFTANPHIVSHATIIEQVNYCEASQLSNFGASILHKKSIVPLEEKNISLRILNTFNPNTPGTTINNDTTMPGIKSISVQDDVSLINIIGKGLLGKKGIDARIFSRLSLHNISVGIISQGSSERGVSFIIPQESQFISRDSLLHELKFELLNQNIQDINATSDISVVTITGQSIGDFSSSLRNLKQNKIDILLINNTINENNISLVIHKKDTKKAINVIHSQIFGVVKTMNIAIIGKGTVGSSFIDQLVIAKPSILHKKKVHLNVFAIAGSKKVLLNKEGISVDWRTKFAASNDSVNTKNAILQYADFHHLENLIIIDNTSSEELAHSYIDFIEQGFDVISSNKIANSQEYHRYKTIRNSLQKHNKNYLYETNVGAGLPIIETIRTLHESGENISRIKGVFSGSLSYLFNTFSESKKPFSHFLKQAIKLGYTEPDPREDLCGNDVGRKLLILARELDLENEFQEIDIENLIPEQLRTGDTTYFLENLKSLDKYYEKKRRELQDGEVLRYVGDLSGNLQEKKGILNVKLIAVSKDSTLGNLTGTNSIFEIYTESYKEHPITIIGAGAGAEVTARGVFGDLLRIVDRKGVS